MKILHVGKYYPPYRGGVETVMEAMCRQLAGRGHDVTALVANDKPEASAEVIDGVRVERVARRWLFKSQPICPALTQMLRAWDGEVVNLHAPNPLGMWQMLRANPPRPWVAIYHSDIVRQKLLRIPAYWLARRFFNKTDAIVVATPRHIEYSNLLPPFREKCKVIHFGIRPEEFALPDGASPESLPVTWGDAPYVLFVGRLVYYKGVEVLLRAVSQCAGARAILVGDGPDRTTLEEMARHLPNETAARVRFAGQVSHSELVRLYHRARAFVLPSIAKSEAFGMVQLEAMACKTPVICTDLPSGVPYVNQHGETGLVVPPEDAGALAEAMAQFLNDPELAQRLGENAQLRVQKEFTEAHMASEYILLYESLKK